MKIYFLNNEKYAGTLLQNVPIKNPCIKADIDNNLLN